MAVRWGIAGAGLVSGDFCLALKTLPEKENCLKAVAARSLERARAFAEKFKVEAACGSYDELVARDDIDVVYVGTINSSHKEISIAALRSGKHVLCEKPAALKSSELDEIFSIAKQKKKIFMEAVAPRFLPLYVETLEAIKNGVIGDVLAAQVTFGNPGLGSVERIMSPDMGGSLLMDIGAYAVNFFDMIFNGQEPIKAHAAGFLTDSGKDISSSVTFLYQGKKVAQALISGLVDLPNEAIVFGTKGKIIVRAPFWGPTQVTINDEDKTYSLPKTIFPTSYKNCEGLRYEADHMRKLVVEKKTESDVMPHSTTKRLLTLVEQCIQQVKNK